MDETEGFQCLGPSNWTICSPLSQFCPEKFSTFSLSYWGAHSYYPRPSWTKVQFSYLMYYIYGQYKRAWYVVTIVVEILTTNEIITLYVVEKWLVYRDQIWLNFPFCHKNVLDIKSSSPFLEYIFSGWCHEDLVYWGWISSPDWLIVKYKKTTNLVPRYHPYSNLVHIWWHHSGYCQNTSTFWMKI